jgi:hypothetical protein
LFPSLACASRTPPARAVLCLLAAAACNQPRFDAAELEDGGRIGGIGDGGQLVPENLGPDGGAAPVPRPDGATGAEGPFLLRVVTEGTGSGSVVAQPGGTCSETCSAMHGKGQTVTLMARPGPPSVFSGWSGGCSGQGTCTVVMDGDRSVVARFDLPEGVTWAKTVPSSSALLASPEGVLVGGAAFGTKMVGDRVFEGGTATTPFLARFGADGGVAELKAYPPGSVTFGGIARGDDDQIVAAGFIGSATAGARTVKLARLSPAGEVLSAVDRPNVEILWIFGSRFLVLGAGGLEVVTDAGVPVPNTQIARPFTVADAVALPDGGWAIGGQFVGTLRLGDRTLSSTTGDWVVARWRADRSVVWVQTSPADKGARIERATTNPAGDLLVAGNFTGQLQLQAQVFPNRGASALFVAKLASASGNVIWGNAISAPLGISCTAITATADAVYVALASPGDLMIEGVSFRARAIVVKYEANTGSHLRTIPLDGAVLNLDVADDALYALGDRLWKLQR